MQTHIFTDAYLKVVNVTQWSSSGKHTMHDMLVGVWTCYDPEKWEEIITRVIGWCLLSENFYSRESTKYSDIQISTSTGSVSFCAENMSYIREPLRSSVNSNKTHLKCVKHTNNSAKYITACVHVNSQITQNGGLLINFTNINTTNLTDVKCYINTLLTLLTC